MKKLFNVAYLGAAYYLVYCAIDRVCLKARDKGFNEGVELGREIGKLEGYVDVMNAIKGDSNEEPKNEEEGLN